MTNGDKIRAMTDEELAEIIMCPLDGEWPCTHRCIECCRGWLKQEANECD